MPGLRNNLLMYNNFLYKLERRNLNRNMYCCTKKEKLKCKARLVATSDNQNIILKNMIHNHGPTFDGNYSTAQPRYVAIEKSKMSKARQTAKSPRNIKKKPMKRRAVNDGSVEIIVVESG